MFYSCFSKKCAVFVCFLCLFCFSTRFLFAGDVDDSVPAENETVVNLSNAVAIALAQNPDLKTAAITVASAKRTDECNWNAFLPSLSLSGSFGNSHSLTDSASGNSGAGDSSSSWSWSGAAGISFSLNAAFPVKNKISALNYEMALTNYNKQCAEIEVQVASAFYSLISSSENIDILKDSLSLAKEQYEKTSSNYGIGLASELELLKAEYSYQSIIPQISQAESSYNSSMESFKLLLGLSSGSNVVLDGTVSPQKLSLPPETELVDTYLDSRFDVIQKKQSLVLAELNLSSIKMQSYAPSLNAGENLRVSNNSQANASSPVSVSGTFSVSVNVPIEAFIPGSSGNLSIKNSEDSISKAEIELDEIRKSARKSIIASASEIERFWSLLDVSKLNEQIASRSYELSDEGYRAGLVSQTELEQSRQQLVSAQQSVLQAEISYINGVYSLAGNLNLSVDKLYELYK